MQVQQVQAIDKNGFKGEILLEDQLYGYRLVAPDGAELETRYGYNSKKEVKNIIEKSLEFFSTIWEKEKKAVASRAREVLAGVEKSKINWTLTTLNIMDGLEREINLKSLLKRSELIRKAVGSYLKDITTLDKNAVSACIDLFAWQINY